METHVKVLAILYIVFSAFLVLGALTLLLVFGGATAIVGTNAPPDEAAIAMPLIGLTGMALSGFMLLLALPGLLTGYGLLKHAGWARILGIVLSALQLINVPLGTILGAYGLWVLLHGDTERMFAQSSAVTRP